MRKRIGFFKIRIRFKDDLYDSYYEWDIAFSCVFQYYETA